MAKARQESLPEMELKSVPEIIKAAEEYETARDEWMEKGAPVRSVKSKLIRVMRKYELGQYRDPDSLLVKVSEGKPKVKVMRGEEEDEGDGE